MSTYMSTDNLKGACSTIITLIITMHIHMKAYSRPILTGKRANPTVSLFFFCECALCCLDTHLCTLVTHPQPRCMVQGGVKLINQSSVCREQLSSVLQLFVLIACCEKTCQLSSLLKLKDAQDLPAGKF